MGREGLGGAQPGLARNIILNHRSQVEDGTPKTGAFGVSGYLAWHI